MVEGGAKCIKYLLFVFNLIFFLAGLTVFVIAIVVQRQINEYASFFGNSNAAVGLIVVGCVIMIVSFWGCCGAYKENYCMVSTFGILLTIVLVLEVVFVVLVYVTRNQIVSSVDNDITKSLDGYINSTAVKATWDLAQTDFHCCGANNYTNWNKILNTNVPDSCCLERSTNCGRGKAALSLSDAAKYIYTQGCVDRVQNFVVGNLVVLGGVGVVLILIQVFVIMFTCCLARSIRKEYEVV